MPWMSLEQFLEEITEKKCCVCQEKATKLTFESEPNFYCQKHAPDKITKNIDTKEQKGKK